MIFFHGNLPAQNAKIDAEIPGDEAIVDSSLIDDDDAGPGDKKKSADKPSVKTGSPETAGSEEKKADWIEKTIDFDIHSERERAINEILTIKNEDLKKKLGKKIIALIETEINSDVKNRAITVAGELKIKEAVPGLLSRLKDENEETRIAAVYALDRIGDASARPVLVEKFREQDFSRDSLFSTAVVDALGNFKADELQKDAADLLLNQSTTKNNREQLVLFLGKIGSKNSKDTLLKLLTDEEEEVNIRALSANSLAKLGLQETSGTINETLLKIEAMPYKKRAKYYRLYIYSIGALVKLGDDSAVPRLIDSCRSNNTSVRLYAIKLMKEIKDKRTIDILKHKAKFDTNYKVQKAAEEALKEIETDIQKQDAASKGGAKPAGGPITPAVKKKDQQEQKKEEKKAGTENIGTGAVPENKTVKDVKENGEVVKTK